jgi:ectoine hydroxylase-related dioxygenase (phytanoyl-CoA dioxygenase family)
MQAATQLGTTRAVTPAEIEEYRESGVVRLRGILSDAWVAGLGDAIDEAIYQQWESGLAAYDVSAAADASRAAGLPVLTDARAERLEKRGCYRTVIGAWTVNEGIRRLALESPLGRVAGELFGARKVNFYDDQTLIKEPGTREYTAFHTDEPYYHLRGDQVCGIWVSPDVVTGDSGAMRYVRGSHRWPSFFKPNAFA